MENYSDLNGARVLVVDDNEYQAKFVADLLADVKSTAVTAGSGQEALEVLAGGDEAFSCVLMDLDMPGMDGFEAAAKIRQLGTVSMSRLPIICMVGGGKPADKDKIFSIGMNGWLAKPVNPQDLYANLRRTINQAFLGQAWNNEQLNGKSAYILSDDTQSAGELKSILSECGIETQVFTEFKSVADIGETEKAFDFAFVKWSEQTHGFSITTKLKMFCNTTFRHIIAIASDWSKIETKATEAGLDAYVLMPFRKYDVINVLQKLLHESSEADDKTASADFAGNKVLIVDDNEMTAMILQNAFESLGAEADIVNSGGSALDRLSSMAPNTYLLVFMDIFMPDMKGFDVAAQFRSMDREDAITLPIIGMSGNSSSQLVEEAIAAGMNALLLKPINKASIRMYMEIFLNEKLQGGVLSDCMKNQINSLKHLNKSLEVERDEAIKDKNARTLFFTQMSHEFRTPLNAILGFAQELLDKANFQDNNNLTSKEQKDYLFRVVFNGNILLNMVNDILVISRLGTDDIVLDIKPNDFNELCKDVVNSYKTLTKAGVMLKSDIVQPMPELEFDYPRFRRILTNFIGNSTKFTSKGSITLYAKFTKQDDTTGTLEFKVVDTGIGINEEDIETLKKAKPFVQVGGKNHAGTGLGISICKKLLERMGGDITIEGELGVGSSFGGVISNMRYHELPKKNEIINDTKPKEPEAEPVDLSSLNALVVDDVESNLDVLEIQLNNLGIKNIFTALNADEALKIVKCSDNNIDVVLTDANMPNADDGKRLALGIRADARFKDLPIYVVTADLTYPDKNETNMFNGVLFKPASIKTLRDILSDVCKMKKYKM